MTDHGKIPDTVVVLANGSFPIHESPLSILANPGFLVCTDGSANKAIAGDYRPDLILGDLDSINSASRDFPCPVVEIDSQDNTDLEKTLVYLKVNNVEKITIIGISGDRDDHHLANLLILNNFSSMMNIQAVTDFFTIDFISGFVELSCRPGQVVSLLSFEQISSISTTGLEFPLADSTLVPSGRGISNRATGNQFSVSSSGPVLIFRSH